MAISTVDGTRLFILDDEGVVFARHRQEIFALNTTATYLWCQIEEGHSRESMARGYARTFRLSAAAATDQVDIMLDRFHDIGLIELPERPVPALPPVSRPESAVCPVAGVPPRREMPVVAEQVYTLLDTAFRLRCSDARQLEWVAPVLRNFTGGHEAGPTVAVDLQHRGDDIFCYLDGTPSARCGGLDELAPVVKGLLWTAAVNRFDYSLNIHAGVVAHGGDCILLPAAAGSGKSLTTAGLVHAGFPYLSDEVALLADDFTVRPLPLAMCFKSTGWDVAARYFDEIDNLAAHQRGDGKIVKYFPVPARYCADSARSYPVKAIVFPRYASDSFTTIEPLPKTQALDRIFRECVSIPGYLSMEKVCGLVGWIKGVRCFRLHFGNLDDAMHAVHKIVAG